MPQPADEDTIRILIATDNHVGYEERDPIRKDDSWKTFDEILNLARKQDVDMVLLAGDLFHDNKPSRKAMYQVMRSLRKNCLGMKPCELEFLSDANEVFEGAFSHVNYEDPDMNISIPVFSIHGNHDDPSGDGHYCSLDLLQVAGLVNYYGRIPEADNIKVKPVLLQKGRTKLALFGLSNVRDERMFRTFRDNHVTWFRPNQQQSDFFNILSVHQNHHAHTSTSYLPENVLPDWMDLVVWGHEHECLIDPRENPETGFHVIQPGSSVATSLVPGEAVPKHVAIVSVTGKDFKVDKIPLKSVRPFVTREIILQKDKRFAKLHKEKDNRQKITRKLMEIVEEMIQQANADWLAIQDDDEEAEEHPLPLVRLKVEYTPPEGGNYEVENPQRFSNRFTGRVANVNDVIYFYRKKTSATRRDRKDRTDGDLPESALEALEALDSENVIKVDALVDEFLAAQSLKVLPQGEFAGAVNDFVEKDDKLAMETFVADSLADQLQHVLNMDNVDEKSLDAAMEKWKKGREARWAAGQVKRQRRILLPKPDDWDSDAEGAHWTDQDGAWQDVQESADQSSAVNGASRGRQPTVPDDDSDAFMDDFEDVPPPAAPAKRATAAKPVKAAAPKKTTATKKAPARGRGKKSALLEDSDEDMFLDDEDEDSVVVPPAKKQPPRAATARSTASAASKRQTTLNFSQSQRATQRGNQKAVEISDDEISEDDAFESMPVTRSRRR
ncbi:putative dna repair protein rad32 protein [Phaeoacremonium minimum UCRPA7]|uniref:Double-strand break repair protein n=1 Tax=Phaeoacremonium minimum (strain UCR-PA7) TaxID=1286976 RepID=R8BBU1_PHAM7|nr:putative dna repair protein rad32 protein [Phaeoacremonium minimum UCRPA7]EON96752.1 putative dna repair protein rad32 protein [Phaeoacremonium minimum UCRPA7]